MKKEILNSSMDNRYPLLDEEDFSQQMQNVAMPFLNSIGSEGFFERNTNEPIYYRCFLPKNPRGTVVIAHGFTESSEKFLEVSYYFAKEGYQVYSIDHRGHGNSYRQNTDTMSLTHIEKFDDYVDDLIYFIDQVVLRVLNGQPLYLYGHSMGGCIGALLLEKRPELFRAAVLSTPMLQVNGGVFPAFVCKKIADYFITKGCADHCVFTHKDFDPYERFERTPGQSRPRYEYYFKKRLADKRLQNYGASYNWLLQSLLATEKALKPENLSRITTPVLLFQAGRDNMVKPGGQNKFIKGIKNGRLIFVKHSKHEIYFGKNEIVSPYVNEVFKFLRSHH